MASSSVIYELARPADNLIPSASYFAERALILLRRKGEGDSGMFEANVLQKRSSAMTSCHLSLGSYRVLTANEHSFWVYLLSCGTGYAGSVSRCLLKLLVNPASAWTFHCPPRLQSYIILEMRDLSQRRSYAFCVYRMTEPGSPRSEQL